MPPACGNRLRTRVGPECGEAGNRNQAEIDEKSQREPLGKEKSKIRCDPELKAARARWEAVTNAKSSDERMQALSNLTLLDVYRYDLFWEAEAKYEMPDALFDAARQELAMFMKCGGARPCDFRSALVAAIAESVLLDFELTPGGKPPVKTVEEIRSTYARLWDEAEALKAAAADMAAN